MRITRIRMNDFGSISDCDIFIDSKTILVEYDSKNERQKDLLLVLRAFLLQDVGDDYTKRFAENTAVTIEFEYGKRNLLFIYKAIYNKASGLPDATITLYGTSFVMHGDVCEAFRRYVTNPLQTEYGILYSFANETEAVETEYDFESVLADFLHNAFADNSIISDYILERHTDIESYSLVCAVVLEKIVKNCSEGDALRFSHDLRLIVDSDYNLSVQNNSGDSIKRSAVPIADRCGILLVCFLFLHRIISKLLARRDIENSAPPIIINGSLGKVNKDGNNSRLTILLKRINEHEGQVFCFEKRALIDELPNTDCSINIDCNTIVKSDVNEDFKVKRVIMKKCKIGL